MDNRPKILVVDDEKGMRDSMNMLLKDSYDVLLTGSGTEAIQTVKDKHVDLVLLDIRLPEIDGLEVLRIIKGIDNSIEVIMVTAVITVGKAVEAIRSGAYDYVTKPFDIQALTEQVRKTIAKKSLAEENYPLKKAPDSDGQFENIIGKSAAIRAVFRTIEDVAPNNTTVLLTGESGTGKELVARAIHNRSPRRTRLFVAVNCAAIPENLLESELFGHEKGSFTGAVERQTGKFELATDGTIFLDEISTLPLPMQAKLLRVIQEKELERIGGSRPIRIDPRIVAATNSNLLVEIKDRKFREDLYYRLKVIPIHLPPLRDRKEDIPLLAEHFVRKYNHEFGKKIQGFKDEVMALFVNYDWPGNIRELENLVERLVVLNKEGVIDLRLLPSEIKGEVPDLEEKVALKFRDAVKQFEAEFIQQALNKAGGKKGKAAKMIGIHRNTLLQLKKKYKIN